MRIFFYVLCLMAIMYYLFQINNAINYKDTEWLPNSPSLIISDPTNTQFCFAVTEPATIYWRIYTNIEDISMTATEFTNANNTNNVIALGGNITRGNDTAYTNIITNLEANKQYYMASIAVSYIGNFTKLVKIYPFKTTQP